MEVRAGALAALLVRAAAVALGPSGNAWVSVDRAGWFCVAPRAADVNAVVGATTAHTAIITAHARVSLVGDLLRTFQPTATVLRANRTVSGNCDQPRCHVPGCPTPELPSGYLHSHTHPTHGSLLSSVTQRSTLETVLLARCGAARDRACEPNEYNSATACRQRAKARARRGSRFGARVP